jgi:hypothetical protein
VIQKPPQFRDQLQSGRFGIHDPGQHDDHLKNLRERS